MDVSLTSKEFDKSVLMTRATCDWRIIIIYYYLSKLLRMTLFERRREPSDRVGVLCFLPHSPRQRPKWALNSVIHSQLLILFGEIPLLLEAAARRRTFGLFVRWERRQ